MQITILGASGKVGQLVVNEAVRRGYSVVALIHKTNPFEDQPEITVIKGDVHNKPDVARAIKGSDAVISTLGSWSTRHKNTLFFAMTNLVPSMQKHGIKRLISLTGGDARAAGDELTLLHRLSHMALHIVGHRVLRDAEKHLRLLEASDLDWTVIRSPIMTTQIKKGNPFHFEFTDNRPRPWHTIHRESVALAIMQALEGKAHIKAAPYLKRAAPYTSKKTSAKKTPKKA